MQPEDVIAFWREAGPEAWFKRSDDFDAAIRERFGETFERAAAGDLDGWSETAGGTLALTIVLDQFSRNLFRDDARAFEHDARGVALARRTLERGWVDELLADPQAQPVAVFALMPLMHSESIVDQHDGVAAMLRPAWKQNFDFAVLHRDIIARFARFPHRNPVLGRATTPAERHYLENGGFGG